MILFNNKKGLYNLGEGNIIKIKFIILSNNKKGLYNLGEGNIIKFKFI